ncbi:MAG TPA: SDR family oxidoreductase [Candidatus Saccharimonadales bacterium]|nr:SDR family oxidoreductase [Candidatus Saccharimonadales bacterium]
MQSVEPKVAVITGASSGIGEATAYLMAERGINVVLAARRRTLLDEVAARCRAMGVDVLVVEADVSIDDDVDRLAQATIDEFGSFDVWINNAAVTVLGSFEEMPPEMFRKVIETNFFGYAYGAWAALRQFRAQGRGLIVNVSSVFGVIPSPYETPYVASKFAVRGFSGALRQELHLQGDKNIHVCTVLPAAIDTPIYKNSANLTGREVQPPPPLYPASKVAEAIVGLIDMPQAEVIVGRAGKGMAVVRALLPEAVFEALFGRYIEALHFKGRTAAVTPGNLFNPGAVGGVSGNWPQASPRRKAAYAAAAVSAGLALAWWIRSHKHSGDAHD